MGLREGLMTALMAADAAVSESPCWPGRGVAAFSGQLTRLHQREGSNYAHTEHSATSLLWSSDPMVDSSWMFVTFVTTRSVAQQLGIRRGWERQLNFVRNWIKRSLNPIAVVSGALQKEVSLGNHHSHHRVKIFLIFAGTIHTVKILDDTICPGPGSRPRRVWRAELETNLASCKCFARKRTSSKCFAGRVVKWRLLIGQNLFATHILLPQLSTLFKHNWKKM